MSNDCVFCDRAKFEGQLIGETRTLYFVATLGQITDGGYTLIIPKRHVSCVAAMGKEEVRKVEVAMLRVSDAIEMVYGIRPIVFEHGIVGQTIQHAHLHLVPANIRQDGKIHEDFPEALFYFFVSLEMLRQLYAHIHPSERRKYLMFGTPGGMLKAVWDPPAPPQYLRIVAAELLGRPERANWRNMDPELDKRLWTETVRRLKPYFS